MAIYMAETTEPIRRGRQSLDKLPRSPFPRLGFFVGDGQLEGIKGVWADTTTIRLEKMLRPLMDAIRRYLQAQRDRRLDEECRQRQREKAEAGRRQGQDADSEEFYLRQELLEEAGRWHDAQKIRAYLTELERRISAGQIQPTAPDRFREWLDWAKWFADDMDPMVKAPPRGKAAVVARNTPVGELDLTSKARVEVARLGVKDSNELLRVPRNDVREPSGWGSDMWQELTLVLEGLGYDVSNRKSHGHF
jgi:uncharacterized membrane protein YccC